MLDDREIEKKLELKEHFKETDFYKNAIICINERVKTEIQVGWCAFLQQ